MVKRWHQSKILLLGGSAGSFKLLFEIVKLLPPDLDKAVIIIMHRKKNFVSEIEKLFAENSRISLREISDKDKIISGTVFIAPANYHTLIEKEGFFSLDVSEPLWYSRPSIDVTFESAAETLGSQCTAILLSGANQDGASGLLKLKNSGSLTIVQDPDDAEMPEMPLSAINLNAYNYVLKSKNIYELLQN